VAGIGFQHCRWTKLADATVIEIRVVMRYSGRQRLLDTLEVCSAYFFGFWLPSIAGGQVCRQFREDR